jgi:cellulase/cellobiase CelA1
VRIDTENRRLEWWGQSKAHFGPPSAQVAGGHSQSFEDFLANGQRYSVPEDILTEIRAALAGC